HLRGVRVTANPNGLEPDPVGVRTDPYPSGRNPNPFRSDGDAVRASTGPGQDGERSERDHLARAARGLKRKRGRTLVRMLRIPFGGRRARIRLDRVEVPAPVGASLLP